MITWTQRFGLRVRLTIVAAAIAALFVTLVVISAVGNYRSGIRALQAQAQIAARLLAAEQLGLEQSTRQLLVGLALATLEQNFSPLLGPDCPKILAKILKASPVFINVGVLDVDGRVACSVDPQATQVSLADRPYFREATTTHAFVVSEPLVSRITHRVTVAAVQPLERADGRLAGVLYAALDLAFLKVSMAWQGLPDGTRMLVIDESGRALLRVPDPENVAGNVIADHEAFAALIEHDVEGFGELDGLTGTRRMVAYVPLRGTAPHRMFVWVGMPLDAVRADALTDALRDCALYAVLVVVLLAIVWWGLERIVIRPINRLIRVADRMGRGDLSARSDIHDGGAEIRQLSGSLDRLALNVQRSTGALRTLCEFVPIAEQTGQIRELTYLVLELAVRQLNAWSTSGLSMPIAVNLSARDLQNPHLTERIEGLLATWGVPASLLDFEVTETALLEDPDMAKKRLEYLRDLGSRIFIDDFGTGYSSLNYLVTLPVHALKIDRSFIVQMATRSEAVTVVASVISMAHGLGLKVVAEGVERQDEFDRLANMRCDEIQGYLIGHPMPATEFLALALGDDESATAAKS